ncbi:MAG: hypothetical protein D6733_01295 [Methanobacteriota archaeon]|nr:MAG: hypothetical protein D6733_01295 [Euryarchaeota archaeon]
MIEVIPVLDIRGGVAVSGRSGNREAYAPLQSVFSDTPDPVEIAGNLPFRRLYVADLDGIVEGRPDLKTLTLLTALKRTMIDLGVRGSEDLDIFGDLDCDIVLGTETVKDREVIVEALERYGARVIVSIDIKDGQVLSGSLPSEPGAAYDSLAEAGVKRFILLNISAVGTMKPDLTFIKDLNKTGEILLGGGITERDLGMLDVLGVDGALIGTALHKGLLDVEEWKS